MTASSYTVLHDGFDRELFTEIRHSTPQLDEPAERLSRLLPRTEELLTDLFCLAYKMNVVVAKEREVEASALLNRRIVQSLLEDAGLAALRARTELDPAASRQALVVLAHRVLAGLRRDDRLVPSELMQAQEAAQNEDDLDGLEAQKARLEEAGEDAFGEELREKVKSSLDQAIKDAKQSLEEARRGQKAAARELPVGFDHDMAGALNDLSGNLGDVKDALSAFGLGSGSGATTTADLRLDLGDKLMRSKKLRLLAKLLGAMKEVAFEARKNRTTRAPQTTHSVRTGSDLAHLLPVELLGVSTKRRGLHLDFLRRYTEQQLLQYELRAPADRGPLVVCVDGSASMQGSKEIWAKAVALTLVELARRQRRPCLGIIFSAGPELFEVELTRRSSARSTRKALSADEVLAFAEHFPNGGTSFTEPLDRAVYHVTQGDYRRGDIVFLTDGESSVPPDLLTRIAAAKKTHRFVIRSIVIDVAQHRTSELEKFSDDVRRVTDLTEDSLTDLFAQF